MKKVLEQKIAQSITDMAMYTVKNSVGKSFPAAAHEVKMPESVRKEFLNSNIHS